MSLRRGELSLSATPNEIDLVTLKSMVGPDFQKPERRVASIVIGLDEKDPHDGRYPSGP